MGANWLNPVGKVGERFWTRCMLSAAMIGLASAAMPVTSGRAAGAPAVAGTKATGGPSPSRRVVLRASTPQPPRAAWIPTAPPLPAGANASKSSVVSDMSCPSAAYCVAVGTYTDSSGLSQGMILTDRGGAWSAQRVPVGTGASSAGAVSCGAIGNCVAIGTFDDSEFGVTGEIYSETGASWKATALDSPPTAGITSPTPLGFRSMACDRAGSCVIITSAIKRFDLQNENGWSDPVFITGSGDSWSAHWAPMPSNSYEDAEKEAVGGIAVAPGCAPSGGCVVAGLYSAKPDRPTSVIWTGSGSSWRMQTDILPPGYSGTSYTQVAAGDGLVCSSSSDCVGTGILSAAGPPGGSPTLLPVLLAGSVHGQWKAAVSPLPPGLKQLPEASDNSGFCLAGSLCYATGGLAPKQGTVSGQGIYLVRRAGKWSAHDAPSLPGYPSGFLYKIACSTATSCGATGYAIDASGHHEQPVLLSGSGTSWRAGLLPTPPVSPGAQRLCTLPANPAARAYRTGR